MRLEGADAHMWGTSSAVLRETFAERLATAQQSAGAQLKVCIAVFGQLLCCYWLEGISLTKTSQKCHSIGGAPLMATSGCVIAVAARDDTNKPRICDYKQALRDRNNWEAGPRDGAR